MIYSKIKFDLEPPLYWPYLKYWWPKIAIGSNKICDAAIISVISLFDLEPHLSQVRLVKKILNIKIIIFDPKLPQGESFKV